jgi:hypothetical protein
MAKKASTGKASSTRKPKASQKPGGAKKGVKAVASPLTVMVVNMIPQSLSSETQQDSEPMIAVNPSNPKEIAATAFTPNPFGGSLAPIYVSSDGGLTWVLNATVPGGTATADISVAFGPKTSVLYSGILRRDNTNLNILATPAFASSAPMNVLVNRASDDQPFANATHDPADPAKDRVYIGNNSFATSPRTASVDVILDAASPEPDKTTVTLETRSTGSANQDGPQVRPAAHPDGTVYAAYYGWRSAAGIFEANTLVVTSDVVVACDKTGATGPSPFTALLDPGDGQPGVRVAKGVSFHFNSSGIPANGQQRLGGTLAIAVDPNNSKTVYLAYGDEQPKTGFTIHVRKSATGGLKWGADLLTLPRATNAALAVNSAGTVGLLYQQLVGTGTGMRWQTHFQYANTDQRWQDLVLADTPANTPAKSFDPYIGDYDHLLTVGNDFFGVFSACNIPSKANFPQGVTYQRNHDFTTARLLGLNGTTVVTPSIDPFFFKVHGL